MKKIIECLLLLLAVSTLTLTMAPSVNGQTENIKILTYSHYIDNLGNIVVVGEVQNNGVNIIANVTLAGTISGSDGSKVSSGCLISAANLLPGQKSPFYMEFNYQTTTSGSWIGVDISDISLRVYQAPATSQYQYQDVVITNRQAAPKDGVYWVECTLKNNGTQTATNIMIYGTYFNSAGTVVATGDIIHPVASLAPQATTTVKVPAFDLNQSLVASDVKISTYSLLVQVQAPLLTGTAPVVNPSATPYAGSSPTASSGTPTNGGDSTIIYAAVVAVVVVVAVLAAVFLVKRRKPKETVEIKPAKPVKPQRTTRRNRK